MQLHDEGVVHRLEDVALGDRLLYLVFGIDVALGQDLERVVFGRCGDLAAALRVLLAGLGESRSEFGILFVVNVAGVLVFLELRSPCRFLALLSALNGELFGHLDLLIMEIPEVEAHDMLVIPERDLAVSLLDEVDLSEGALAQSPHHLEVVDGLSVNLDNFQLFRGLLGDLAAQVVRGEGDLREAL